MIKFKNSDKMVDYKRTRLLGRLIRPVLWTACCIAAVGIHHTWFSIGTRGTLMACADGAVLFLLSVVMHLLYRKIVIKCDQERLINNQKRRTTMENPAVSPNNFMNPDAFRPKQKRVRVKAFKEEVVAENAVLKIKIHNLETWIKNFKQLPTMRRIMFAAKVTKGDQVG